MRQRDVRHGLLIAAALVVGVASALFAAPDDPPSPIAFVTRYLGPGVVGGPVAAPVIATPRDYLPGVAAELRYQVRQPDGSATTTELVEVEPSTSTAGGQRWSVRIANRSAWFVEQESDGALVRTSQVDTQRALLSSFAPPELILPPGLAPGERRQRTIAVTVSDVTRPGQVEHRGSLTQTVTYVGAWSVTVPAGTFDAVLIDVEYSGSVGPASIHDHVAFFYAKGAGCVASVEHRSVSAFLVYNVDERHGRLLTKRSTAAAPP